MRERAKQDPDGGGDTKRDRTRERERQRQTERATVTTKTKHRVSYTQYPLQQLTSHVHAKTINNMQEHHNTHTHSLALAPTD